MKVSTLCALIVLAGTADVCNGFSLRSARSSDLSASDEKPPTLAVFAHHKAGDEVSAQITHDSARILGMPHKVGYWLDVNNANGTVGCFPNSVVDYEDMTVPVLERIYEQCPDIRAIHLIRRPTDLVTANFVDTRHLDAEYMKQLSEGAYALVKAMQGVDMMSGVKLLCDAFFQSSDGRKVSQLLEVHDYLEDKKAAGFNNVMEVKYEDFKADYNKTAHKVFHHFLGKKVPHAVMSQLVGNTGTESMAALFETGYKYTALEEDTVRKVMGMLYKKNDACITKLVNADETLGYSPFSQ